MWIVLGFYYTFVGQGIMQLHGYDEFENPEDCFRASLQVMMDEDDPRHMACVPLLKPVEES